MKIIAITGGPCAGKTSAMNVLQERLDREGLPAVFIPEAATDLITSGVAPWTCASTLDFQTRVIALQLEREAAALAQAAATGAAAIISDRGICDSHAYLSDDEFQSALAANGITRSQAFARYDAVFHLESVAKSDPGAYTRANNSARFETAEEAALADDRVTRAWSGHPGLHVIGSCPGFDEKAAALCDAIVQLISQPGNSGEDPVLVSACLLGAPCRYDGKSQPCQAVIELARRHELIAVCPEQLGGLPTPRTPSEIQPDGRVLDAAGADNTLAFESGARKALEIAREHGCTRAILKENSPSCGVHRIYDGSFSGALIPGKGKTAALLSQHGIALSSESEYGPYVNQR